MADTSIRTEVSTKEVDYLDEDKPIRGQNYVCLSFLSPEETLANKEVYAFSKYLKTFATNLQTMIAMLKQRYPNDHDLLNSLLENNAAVFDGDSLQDDYRLFRQTNGAEIDNEFLEKNDFKTCVRGIKVRGCFDTLKEAQLRAEVLKRMGDKFDIFIGQVGCWCPWSPNPGDLEDQEFAETQLNTLMKKYKENAQLKDAFFEQRKQDKIDKSILDKDAWTKRQAERLGTSAAGAAGAADENVAPTNVVTEAPSADMTEAPSADTPMTEAPSADAAAAPSTNAE